MQIFKPLGNAAARPLLGLIFDLGSTLIYFDADWLGTQPEQDAALLNSLRTAGLRLDEPTFIARFRGQLQAYYAERETEFIEHTTAYILRGVLADLGFPQIPDEVVGRILTDMYAVTQAYWRPEPEVHAILGNLKLQGYRLGMISNAGDDADVQTLIDQCRLRSYFEVILTSAGEGIRKPNPKIFWTALDRLGIASNQAAMIGDTLGADILGAQNSGMYSIWITRRAGSPANRDHADTIQPDAVIDQIDELPKLLASLKQL